MFSMFEPFQHLLTDPNYLQKQCSFYQQQKSVVSEPGASNVLSGSGGLLEANH